MLDVISVSLGSSRRDTDQEIDLLGKRVRLRRVGTGGDLAKARSLVAELDGQVDAIGLGGIDLYVLVRNKRYYFKDALRIAEAARKTPVVCGSGLKNSLERRAIAQLEPVLDLSDKRVLMVSAVDRFGMAEELYERAQKVVFGDVIFALGLPFPVKTIQGLERLAHLLMPVVSRVPFRWLYPVGEAQEKTPNAEKFARYYDAAEIIAGDWHFIWRYAPADLSGKTIITNTTTTADVEFLRQRGVANLITTTPRYNGRSIGTNLLEAALVAQEGAAGELGPERYVELAEEAGFEPTVMTL